MNDSTIVQLVVQTGAIGLCFAIVVYQGGKIDKLAVALSKLTEKIGILVSQREP